jgi:hypothetical protein
MSIWLNVKGSLNAVVMQRNSHSNFATVLHVMEDVCGKVTLHFSIHSLSYLMTF